MSEDHTPKQDDSLDGLLKLIAKTIADKIIEEQKEALLNSEDSKGTSDIPASASVQEKGKEEPRKYCSGDEQTPQK